MLRRSKGSIEEARRDRQLHLPEMYDSERLSAPTDGLFAANQQVHPRDAAGLWKEKDLWAWAKDYLEPRLEALHTSYGSGPENVQLRVLTIRELEGSASVVMSRGSIKVVCICNSFLLLPTFVLQLASF